MIEDAEWMRELLHLLDVVSWQSPTRIECNKADVITMPLPHDAQTVVLIVTTVFVVVYATQKIMYTAWADVYVAYPLK